MAKDISEIDKALRADGAVNDGGKIWYPAACERFLLTGLLEDGLKSTPPKYVRMPSEIAATVNTGVSELYSNTAGGKLRITTDSEAIAIRVKWTNRTSFSHMPLTGTSGFDLFVDKDGASRYAKTFIPPYNSPHGYEGEYRFGTKEMRSLQINFPLYNSVDEIYIGLDEDASILAPNPFNYGLPIVYYGSSITQGGCASKPSSSYQAMISRWLNVDHVNLGFSGSAHAEKEMAEYIADIPMLLFVMDYDFNAPTAEYLEKTHYPFYKVIREKNPTLPIICVTAYAPNEPRRKEIIEASVKCAMAEGDKNIYFVDGNTFFPKDAVDNCTVDGVHPNDLGFYFMAKKLLPVIEEVLSKL